VKRINIKIAVVASLDTLPPGFLYEYPTNTSK
jgi:hypothetical protein